ncbi:hypothetical protein BsWGS_01730 [Bradybaena similaris]
MPVHRKKNLSPTPASLYSLESEDDTDYLLDPDKLYDRLPQPYQMINSVLKHILDSVWEIVEEKYSLLLAESSKSQAPQFAESQMLNLYHNATALTPSADSKYLFVGLPNGLAVLDVATLSSVQQWEQDRTEITSIKSYPFGSNYNLIMTQDDMEQVRLFLFAYDTLFFIKAINENAPENSAKILCQKWEASSGGEFAGFVFQETSTKEVWLEVLRLPLESWISDLDNIGAAAKLAEQLEMLKAENTDDGQISEVTYVSANVSIKDKLDTKFSNPTPVLKIRPPPEIPLPDNPVHNIASAIHKVDTGDVLGTGLSHVLGRVHLESLDAMFRYRHEDEIKYLPLEHEEQSVSAAFHFVSSSRMMPNSLDQNTADTEPVGVIVWWTNSSCLSHYFLLKAGKDTDLKPDMVWPFASKIMCSALSSCMTYLAIGLNNGNIILWNRQLGLHKAVLNASKKTYVKSMRFLDPSLFPLDLPRYPPYPTMSATFLLAECLDGTQMLFDTCDGSQQIPRLIAEEPRDDDDVQILLQVIPNLPELITYIRKMGSMYIKDIGTGADVCQIVLPPKYQIQTAWNPIFAFAKSGDILFLKGEGTDVDDTGRVEKISGIFMFDLLSCPHLDTFRSHKQEKRKLSVHTTQEQRMSALLQERIQQQAARKSRLQERWGQLKSELSIIQQARKVPVNTTKLFIDINSC